MIGAGDIYASCQDAADGVWCECPGCGGEYRADGDWYEHGGKEYCPLCIASVEATLCMECGRALPDDGQSDARSCPECNLTAAECDLAAADKAIEEIHNDMRETLR